MILPIVALGHPTLKKVAQDIDKDYPELNVLIENMFETMYNAEGVGLAAPQINKSIRLFVIDANPYEKYYPEAKDFKKVFINPQIISEEGEEWYFNEGCLSLPDVHEDVARKSKVLLRYMDENFQEKEEWFEGVLARVIQHEYDHLEGVVFTDRLSNVTKLFLRKRLNDIRGGNIRCDYKMTFGKR
ncbi:peptide deformylase [Bacteroidales bacterium OttesenSCG-928-K03]|nr:peptide deformylase [Odoribacter sp. OttesenSCG-928-L07]MDL2238823.1 peptide deformylase [Bacteroidales bacterium OttesenSCG-928-L14]MDL2240244.1 peptide deformylase [Bacteroidales bacterium OttesenSCG-928-K22]MDL2242420.1 peptide deformylase [Bacteroidales bacterium OttesenSCG-928-K03]